MHLYDLRVIFPGPEEKEAEHRVNINLESW